MPDLGLDAECQAQCVPWQSFVSETGGQWVSHWSHATHTPKAIYGTGLPILDWQGDTQAEAARHAQRLLADRSELLGIGASEMREAIAARIGNMWSFVYDQYFRGLPVIGGRADVRVHRTGKISMFGSEAFPIAADFVVVPTIDALNAERLAWQALGTAPHAPLAGDQRVTRLVIWGDIDAAHPVPVVLAWEVPIAAVAADGSGPVGRYYIDAHRGLVVAYANDKHECGMPGCKLPPRGFVRADRTGEGTGSHESHGAGKHGEVSPVSATPVGASPALPPATGTVRAWLRTGTTATSPLVNVPLPGLKIAVPGVGNVVTDANGNFTATVAAATTVSCNLAGIHNQNISGVNPALATFTLSPTTPANVQFLTSTATALQAAHTTTYWWIYRVNEFCRSVLGNTAQLNTADNVLPSVNISSSCNAYYTANTINFYAAGGTCNNTGFSTVVAHEWGHGLDDRYGGISQVNGLSEGWGDIIAMYLTDQPLVGEGFFTNGGSIRTGDNTRQYPTGVDVHDQGESWMGFAWHLRQRLATSLGSRAAAITLTNSIVLGSIAANAGDQYSAVSQVFLADDNDANLLNGTPHSVDLIAACDQHSLPNPVHPPTAPPNDECGSAIAITSGVNGPFTNSFASNSQAWPCVTGGADVWFRYVPVSAGTLIAATCTQASFDTVMQILTGPCGALVSLACNDDACGTQSSVTTPVAAGVTYYIRVGGFNSAQGPFSLNVTGPPGVTGGGPVASAQSYGSGCYSSSKAFYEYFGASGVFDLGNRAMTLVRSGQSYSVNGTGAFVTPGVNARVLTLADDSEATFALTGTFSYPGGTTSALTICSNGFVSAAPGNGVAFAPTAAAWLASTQARWGTWHDFNPAAGGRVRFEQVGTIAYVTWESVVDYAGAVGSTWQLQFQLANGNVTFAWNTLNTNGSETLIGYASGSGDADLGSMDLSVRVASGFATSTTNLSGLTQVASVPRLGSTVTLTTTNYPTGAVLGIGALSVTRYDPGLDMASLGMPGCAQYVGFDASYFMPLSAGQSTRTIVLPLDPALSGLTVGSQSFALVPGVNARGAVASNGVSLIIGS